MSKVNGSQVIWAPRRIHLLIDPDKWEPRDLSVLFQSVPKIIGSIIVGGTFLHSDSSRFEAVMERCTATGLPVGNIVTASAADSLISPSANFVLVPILFGSSSTRFVLDHLIRAVPVLKRYNLPCIAYAYLMLAGGTQTSAEFFTQTISIPRDKPEILRTLSLAAKYLGLCGIYLEAGSGAQNPVTSAEVAAVVRNSDLPLLVGGGISSAATCKSLFHSGATGLVIGTALERARDLGWISELI